MPLLISIPETLHNRFKPKADGGSYSRDHAQSLANA